MSQGNRDQKNFATRGLIRAEHINHSTEYKNYVSDKTPATPKEVPDPDPYEWAKEDEGILKALKKDPRHL